MEKDEYKIAVDYYKNDDTDDFTIEEAIEKFENIKERFPKANYDLFNLYIDNYDENDIEANKKALKYLENALKNGEGTNTELGKMKLRLADSYRNNREIIPAIELYLNLEGEKSVDSKIINCLDELNRKSKEMSLEDKNQVLNCALKCRKSRDKRIMNKSLDIINRILEEISYKNTSICKTEADFNKIKYILDKYSNYSSNSFKISLYDNYYEKYGNYLFDNIKNIGDAKKTLEVYDKISTLNIVKTYGMEKTKHWIGMYLIKNSTNKDELSNAFEFLKDIKLSNFYESDLKDIEKLIKFLIENKYYNLAIKYSDEFHGKTNNNYQIFSELSNEAQKKAKFEVEIKKALNENNYDSQLYIAEEYEKGIIVDKDMNKALTFHLMAFENHINEKSFSFLKEYYGGYISLLNELKNHYTDSFITQIEDIVKKEKFYNFENYLYNSNDTIRIDDNIRNKDLSHFYPYDKSEKCKLCDSSKDDCRKWHEYYSICSNEVYNKLYLDYYTDVNDRFFNKISIDFLDYLKGKKEITIVLVGCGNFYELKSLHRWYGIKLNVIILDQFLWQRNQLDVFDISEFNNIWFKKCDFYDELIKDIYAKADIIYFSRCIIPYNFEFNFKNAIPFINSIIKNNQITIFSEVLSVNLNRNGENKAVKFENDFKEYIFLNFNCTKSYVIDFDKYHNLNVHFDRMLDKSLVNYDINIQKSLRYFLFYIKGRK